VIALNSDWLSAGDSDHISHQFDVWLMDNPLPEGFERGMTEMVLALD
jgi:hypothetical protein